MNSLYYDIKWMILRKLLFYCTLAAILFTNMVLGFVFINFWQYMVTKQCSMFYVFTDGKQCSVFYVFTDGSKNMKAK